MVEIYLHPFERSVTRRKLAQGFFRHETGSRYWQQILAADTGSTNAQFGCLERKPDGGWAAHNFAKVKGSDFESFDDAIISYLSQLDTRPTRAAFAAADPVQSGYIESHEYGLAYLC